MQALGHQTEAEGHSGKDYRDAFLIRLNTLVWAHDLAFDAAAASDLSELIGRILAPTSPTGK